MNFLRRHLQPLFTQCAPEATRSTASAVLRERGSWRESESRGSGRSVENYASGSTKPRRDAALCVIVSVDLCKKPHAKRVIKRVRVASASLPSANTEARSHPSAIDVINVYKRFCKEIKTRF